MARKAAAADPDSGTTNVNIADFQRTRDSVRPVLEVSSVSLLLLRVKTAHRGFVQCKQCAPHLTLPNTDMIS